MLRRNDDSEFVGGAYLFPGGALESQDEAIAAEDLGAARATAPLSARMGVERSASAYGVAAIRECFEESGILFARVPGAPELLTPSIRPALDEHRRSLNHGTLDFAELLEREGLELALDSLYYFAHWVTPRGGPRRYDARFFVAFVGSHDDAIPDAREMVAAEWVRPRTMLLRYRDGEVSMLWPTLRNLYAISRFSGVASLRDALEASDTPPIEMVDDMGGRRRALPGEGGPDAEYAPTPPQSFYQWRRD